MGGGERGVVTGGGDRHAGRVASPRFELEDCADDVAALADELGIETFIPVGFSMGSLVAQQVWRRHRDRVDALVLCAAAATFGRATHERLATGVFAALLEAFGPQPGRPTRRGCPSSTTS